MKSMQNRGFTLVELLVVMVFLALLAALLMAALSRARQSAIDAKLRSNSDYGYAAEMANENSKRASERAATTPAMPAHPLARVSRFDATIALTPKLSVGTAEPESIYEASFTARLEASRPRDGSGECEIELPLPPQIISLTDLSVSADGQPSEMVALRDGKLIWRGALKAEPTKLQVTYAAVGKGLYTLDVPPGGILDSFNVTLTAHGSDVRMLDLSLQPTSAVRASGTTTYTWGYQRLMFGRPISLDVLGIAPIDRLGELSWLGPLSVLIFGLILGLVSAAYPVAGVDRWTLLLILGTFTGAYPLMYFAQQFVSPPTAILVPAATVMLIILLRSVTAMGLRVALLGVVVPGALIMAIALAAATQPSSQGLLLTAEAIAVLIVAMALMSKREGTIEFRSARPAMA